MHLDTFAMQAQPLVFQIQELKAVLRLTDEELPKQYSTLSGLPSSLSIGAVCLMKDILDDRLDGSDSASEAGLRRRNRLIAAGGVHSFTKDMAREEHCKALHDILTEDMSSPAPGTLSVPIDVSEAPGSENGSTDPSPAAAPAAPNAPVAELTVPTVPAVAPPASEPYSGPDLADGLSLEDQEAALSGGARERAGGGCPPR